MSFSYQFPGEVFDNMYRAEQRIGKVALTYPICSKLTL